MLAQALPVIDPAGVRHVLATNAANYVRPTFTPRVVRPLIGDGLFLVEGSRWRQQRRMLSPVFTPHNVGALLPHFSAAANDLVAGLERAPVADLSAAFQDATLEAVFAGVVLDAGQRAACEDWRNGSKLCHWPGAAQHPGRVGTHGGRVLPRVCEAPRVSARVVRNRRPDSRRAAAL